MVGPCNKGEEIYPITLSVRRTDLLDLVLTACNGAGVAHVYMHSTGLPTPMTIAEDVDFDDRSTTIRIPLAGLAIARHTLAWSFTVIGGDDKVSVHELILNNIPTFRLYRDATKDVYFAFMTLEVVA